MGKHVVIGSGGGKGGSDDTPTESANTLRSSTIARLVELLGSGEVVGLVDADGMPVTADNIGNAVFLDQTPVQNSDGTFNFKGVQIQQRVGLPDQDYLNGFTQAETGVSVNTQVKKTTGPVIRTINDLNADAVRVVARIPALSQLHKDTGDLTGTSVNYAFDRRNAGGDWVEVVNVNLVNQKCTSPYTRAHRIPLPADQGPWDLRMRRITNDSDAAELANETWWDAYFTLVEGKFIYPNKALVALEIEAKQFGSSIPARGYRVKGLITDVPTNYDPETRTYTGVWDGTFKKAWHSNPAWVFYDLLVNNRYGLGEFMDAAAIDKWGLYAIGRYCDELVSSGYKDDLGDDIMEPRFAFHGVINTRKEAFKVLQDITSAFRGMAYWSLGQVFASADMPTDPITTITKANVVNGKFKYSGTALKARHSVALVSWNDPNDFFRPAIELVQDDDALARFGWREIEVACPGCTSRGQAVRFGKWILDTEQNETETVEFDMSWDGYVRDNNGTLVPGNIIMVADPRKAGGVRLGGRLRAVTDDSNVTLDAPFEPAVGITYTLSVVLPDGSLETKTISGFSSGNVNIALSAPFSQTPEPNAIWLIQGLDVNARRYRVMSVQEQEDDIFHVTALFNDPNKYARVEQNIKLDPISYTRPRNVVTQPTNLSAVETHYFQNGVSHSRVILSWTGPNDFLSPQYTVTADSPRGFVDFGTTSTPSIDITDAVPGDWTFYVSARLTGGQVSVPVSFNFTVGGWEAIDGPIVSDLALIGGGTTFPGTAPTLTWTHTFPTDEVVYEAESVVRVYDVANNLLRTDVVPDKSYTYTYEKNVNDGGPRRALRFDVTVKKVTGEESVPASISVTNPVPAAVVPTIRVQPNQLEVSYTPPADNDFAGAMIWVSTTNGFDPSIVTPTYDGPDTKVTVGLDASTYYVRVAVYDSFGKTGLNISSQISANVTSVDAAISAVLPGLLASTDFSEIAGKDEALSEVLASFIQQMIEDRDANDAQHQRTRQILAAESGAQRAMIISEQQARVEAVFAEATARQVLEATINDNVLAAIVVEQTARASADSALASSISTVATQVDGHTASLSTIQASVDGVSVKYGVVGTIDGVTGGFLFQGVQQLDGSVAFDLLIEGSVIVDGSITTDKLSVNELTAISANFGSATVSGAITSANGKMTIDFTNNRITVQD